MKVNMKKKFKEKLYVYHEETFDVLDTDTLFYIDGYDFGDRLLEGVYFYAKISDDRYSLEIVKTSAPDYMENLNKNKWYKTALNHFNDYVFVDESLSSSYIIAPESEIPFKISEKT